MSRTSNDEVAFDLIKTGRKEGIKNDSIASALAKSGVTRVDGTPLMNYDISDIALNTLGLEPQRNFTGKKKSSAKNDWRAALGRIREIGMSNLGERVQADLIKTIAKEL